MDKILREKLNHWIDLSNSIEKIYLRLIELEQMGLLDSEEYKNLRYILPDAIRFEEKALNDLNLNAKNVREVKMLIDFNVEDLLEDICTLKSDKIGALRRSNMLDEYLLKRNNFADEMQATNLFELIAQKNYMEEVETLKYATEHLNIIKCNFIRLLEEEASVTEDKEIKDYLISLKYRMIATTPYYEDTFLYFKTSILPFRQLNKLMFLLDEKKNEELKDLNRYNIKVAFLEDLVEMFCYTDEMLEDTTSYKEFIRIKLLNEARLMSLLEIDFLNDIRDNSFIVMPQSCIYSKVVETHIDTLSKVYTEYHNQKQKKRR